MRCFRADQVWTGSQLLTGVDVIVEGTDIVAIGPAEETAGEAQVIDLAGHTLLPGLIDAHVHLGFDSQVDPITQHRATRAPYLALHMAENARKLVSCGVTTARDLGAPDFVDIALRDAITAGITVGPNLLVATRPITPTGGRCWYLGGLPLFQVRSSGVARQRTRLKRRRVSIITV